MLARRLLSARLALRTTPFTHTHLFERGLASVNEASGAHKESADETPPMKTKDMTPVPYARGESVGDKSFRDYIAGKVFIVTGAGGRFLHPEAIRVAKLTFSR
jgi:hypothetical protein